MKQECISYFFGICVQSEQQALEIILAWGVGTLVGIAMLIGSFVFVLLTYWWRRNRAVETIDAILSGKPTKSKFYSEIKSPFW